MTYLRNVCHFCVIILMLLTSANFTIAQNPQDVRLSQGLFSDAKVELQNNNFDAFESKIRRALSIRPMHPQLMLNYAYALTLINDHEGALEQLNQIAGMGLYFDVTGMKEFSKLSDKKSFKKICNKFENNLKTIGNAEVILELNDKDLLVEGIEFDHQTSSYFITSVHKKKILNYDSEGNRLYEIKLNLSPLGIKIDSLNNSIWVTTSGVEQAQDTDESVIGISEIIEMDLSNGSLKRKYTLKKDSLSHLFGDLLVLDSLIYITDSKNGTLYQYNTLSANFDPVTDIQALISPQGLLAGQNNNLIVADYSIGLVNIDRTSGKVRTLKNLTNTTLLGIDGIYRYQSYILAVQNGVFPNRVLKLALNPEETKVISYEVLVADQNKLDDPTLATIIKDQLILNANSQWRKFSPGYENIEKRKSPQIISIQLNE